MVQQYFLAVCLIILKCRCIVSIRKATVLSVPNWGVKEILRWLEDMQNKNSAVLENLRKPAEEERKLYENNVL